MASPVQPIHTSNASYHVAIICFSLLEGKVIRTILKQQNKGDDDVTGTDSTGTHEFQVGKVGEHDVVLMIFRKPDDAARAHAVDELRLKFPFIELALVVGSCSGLPTPKYGKEINIGDIVMSSQSILFALGSYYEDGFQKGTLHNGLPAQQDTAESALWTVLDKAPKNLRKISSKEPSIHIGTIASCDQLVRSRELRDKIAASDPRIIAFEFGRVNMYGRFPCLVNISCVFSHVGGYGEVMNIHYASTRAASVAEAFLKNMMLLDSRKSQKRIGRVDVSTALDRRARSFNDGYNWRNSTEDLLTLLKVNQELSTKEMLQQYLDVGPDDFHSALLDHLKDNQGALSHTLRNKWIPSLKVSELRQGLQRALEAGDERAAKSILDYSHLLGDNYKMALELMEAQCGLNEIAEFLKETDRDDQWIHYENRLSVKPIYEKSDLSRTHVPNCVHNIQDVQTVAPGLFKSPLTEPAVGDSSQSPYSRKVNKSWSTARMISGDVFSNVCESLDNVQAVRRLVQELCGIGGISPSRLNPSLWGATVYFDKVRDKSIASISYDSWEGHMYRNGETSPYVRHLKILDEFMTAALHVHQAGLCCNSFTIMQKGTGGVWRGKSLEVPVVRLIKIEFRKARNLQSALEKATTGNEDNYSQICHAALGILRPFLGSDNIHWNLEEDRSLHLCSLAIQLLCLGLVSYCQGHIGELHPFFLDEPLAAIHLLGCLPFQETLVAELTDMSCVGEMTEGPVLAFSLAKAQATSWLGKDQLTYDLLGSADNILDTWGPGQAFSWVNKGDIIAISVGGGFITATGGQNPRYHWSRDWEAPPGAVLDDETRSQLTFDFKEDLLVGARHVKINTICKLNQQEIWDRCLGSLSFLGPYRPYWEERERQFGLSIQPIQFIQGIANHTTCKVPGLTLKRVVLDQPNEFLVQYLDYEWAVEVSICTTVARRVRLRTMIADLLPLFSKVLLIPHTIWEDLNEKHGIVENFRHGDLVNWVRGLDSELRTEVLKLVGAILRRFQDTGIDRHRKHLIVAWPNDTDVARCIKISCEGEAFWTRILADSTDCVTFAYMSSRCLVTQKVQCSGSHSGRFEASALLSTSMCPAHAGIKSRFTHDKSYYVRTMEGLIRLRVHQPLPNDDPVLICMPSRLQSFTNRLSFMDWWKERLLREAGKESEHANPVIVGNEKLVLNARVPTQDCLESLRRSPTVEVIQNFHYQDVPEVSLVTMSALSIDDGRG